MKTRIVHSITITAIALLFNLNVGAQVAIRESGTTAADPTSMLDVVSTDKGVLVPRMTIAQRDAIGLPGTPATGLLIYQTDNTPGFYYFDGSSWVSISGTSGIIPISSGGTGQTTANNALNALLPSQTTPYTYLSTDGTNSFFAQVDLENNGITGILPQINGGTGSNNGNNLVPEPSSAIDGYFLSNDGISPVWKNITPGVGVNSVGATSPLGISGTAGDPVVVLSSKIPVSLGGTNSSTPLTNNQIMVSNSGEIKEAGVMNNGQILIGSTGVAPVLGNITSGSNFMKVTNGSGSISIDANVANVILPSPDFTTTSTSFVDVANLAFNVKTGENWSFEFNVQNGISSGTGAAGLQFSLAFDYGTVRATIVGMSGSQSSVASAVLTSSGANTINLNTVTSSAGWTRICGTILNPGTDTSVKLQIKNLDATRTSTVYAGSYLTARRN